MSKVRSSACQQIMFRTIPSKSAWRPPPLRSLSENPNTISCRCRPHVGDQWNWEGPLLKHTGFRGKNGLLRGWIHGCTAESRLFSVRQILQRKEEVYQHRWLQLHDIEKLRSRTLLEQVPCLISPIPNPSPNLTIDQITSRPSIGTQPFHLGWAKGTTVPSLAPGWKPSCGRWTQPRSRLVG